MLRLLLFVLPLGLDTLGVSVSLGIKGARAGTFGKEGKRNWVPPWLGSALLFSLAETVMPLVGLLLGYASSVVISYVMQVVGPLLLIAVGLWELQGEIRERLDKSKGRQNSTEANPAKPSTDPKRDRHWGRQLPGLFDDLHRANTGPYVTYTARVRQRMDGILKLFSTDRIGYLVTCDMRRNRYV